MGKTNAHTHITTLLCTTATIKKTKTHSKMPQESEEGKEKIKKKV